MAGRPSSTAPATPWCAPRTGRSSRRSTRSPESVDPAELRAALGPAGGELTRLLPDLPARVGELAPPVTADPDTERHRLHTAVTDLLAGLSRDRPLLLVLEDGHWADAPTLLLLRHLARTAGAARMLLLATFRDTDADVGETLSETLADLRRSEAVVRLRLGGLSDAEVTEFVRRAAGGDVGPPELARTIAELTDGNAFLVCELWRALVETGAVEVTDGHVRLTRPLGELGTPESVREVVSQRLARLAPRTTDVLELMATAGPEFGLAMIRHAAGLPEPEVRSVLDEAVRSGMIEELPARRLAYRFTHELVRRALYDRLSGVRRAELHLCVGEALERADGRSSRTLADLAHHFAAAAPFDGAGRGPEYNLSAARAATAALAFDEAAARLRTALELGIERPRGPRRGVPGARHGQPSRRQGARRPGRVPGHGRHRTRAGRRRAAGPRGHRLRGRMLAPGHARPGCRRAAGGGRGRARRRELGAARRPLERARARARPPGRPRARSHRAHERRGDGPAAGGSCRPGQDAGAVLLVAGHELARGDPRDAHRGRRDRQGARGHGARRRGDVLARPGVRRAGRPRRGAARDRRAAPAGRADRPALHHARVRALRRGARTRRRATRRGGRQGPALARVEPAADGPRRHGCARHPDVRDPPRAGPPGGDRACAARARRRRRARGAVAAGAGVRAGRDGDGEGGAAGAREGRGRRPRALPRVALARRDSPI